MARIPFGGKKVYFLGCKASLQEVFGTIPVGPGEMNKKLWRYIKDNGLFK